MSHFDTKPLHVRVADINELQHQLTRLDAPQLGSMRVFRGQSKRHSAGGVPDSLKAALHRAARSRYDEQWLTAARTALFGKKASDDRSGEYLNVWLPALLQHYGPGSYFLDVTNDLDVALWFALHKYEHRKKQMRLLFGGETAHIEIELAWYESISGSKDGAFDPVIYVIDVFRWPGFESPAHADLVAISELPAGQRVLNRATRLEKQAAYLLYASPEAISGPDLVWAPRAAISFSPQFVLGDRASAWQISDLFPPPRLDPCYASLMTFPLAIQNPGHYGHPLNIPCFISSDEAKRTAGNRVVSADSEIHDFVSRLTAI